MIQLVLAVLIFLAGVAGGIKWHAGQDAIKENARIEQEQKERGRKLAAADLGAVAHEKDKVVIRKEFVDREVQVEKIVTKDKLVYSTICITPDGLSVIADSIAGRTSTGVVTSTVPGTVTATVR